jgi:UDPglucose 6-dehydrogenase
MRVGIVGFGHVGKAMQSLFPKAVVYDEPLQQGTREAANACEVAFVCVPTPSLPGGACDTSIVEEVIGWLDAQVIVIRSTVPVGFTDSQKDRTGKRIVFQPEYYGETVDHPFADLKSRSWLTFGGDAADVAPVIRAFQQSYNAEVKIRRTDARTAELAKYMENCFLALKVTFCNEFFDIAGAYGVDYNELREVWLEDPRMGRSHTFVYEDKRGYGGKCLPKDISALIEFASEKRVNVELMQAVQAKNKVLTGAQTDK